VTVVPIAQYLVQFGKDVAIEAEAGREILPLQQSFDPRAEEELALKLEAANAAAREEGQAAAAAGSRSTSPARGRPGSPRKDNAWAPLPRRRSPSSNGALPTASRASSSLFSRRCCANRSSPSSQGPCRR